MDLAKLAGDLRAEVAEAIRETFNAHAVTLQQVVERLDADLPELAFAVIGLLAWLADQERTREGGDAQLAQRFDQLAVGLRRRFILARGDAPEPVPQILRTRG